MEGFSMAKIETSAVDFFTADEHAVLARWFEVEPPADARHIVPDQAVSRLGFGEEPDQYRSIDAAVAFIVLERVEQRLPQWACINAENVLILAREYRTQIKNRKVLVQPQHLFTINWADSGPGFSWPTAYNVTWLPLYDRFVVTASADSPDAYGYCDFAIGGFGIETPVKEGAKKVICEDWTNQEQQRRWAYLFSTGLISQSEANAWADEVWASERDKAS
jgi:hypothetical protein